MKYIRIKNNIIDIPKVYIFRLNGDSLEIYYDNTERCVTIYCKDTSEAKKYFDTLLHLLNVTELRD